MASIPKALLMRFLRCLPIQTLYTIRREAGRHLGYGSGGRQSQRDEVLAALCLVSATNPTVIDGGANVGVWSRLLLELIGSEPELLILVEPIPVNAAKLENEFSETIATVVRAALDSKDGFAPIYFDPAASALSSMYRRDLSHVGLSLESEIICKTLSVDTLITDFGLEKVDLLKLDVEGHEFAVLQGAQKALSEHRIRTVAFEFGGCNVDSRIFFKDFWTKFSRLGYRIFRIAPHGRLIWVNQYSESEETFLTTNYLASVEEPAK